MVRYLSTFVVSVDGPDLPSFPGVFSSVFVSVTVLENEKGEVLNIGRRARIIPPHIQRALQARDHGHCQYPGCENSRYTDAHHVKHWADGGETCLDNLVTQCRHHHRAHHQGEFTITPGDIAGESRFHDVFGKEILPAAWPQFPEQEGPEAEVLAVRIIPKTFQLKRASPPGAVSAFTTIWPLPPCSACRKTRNRPRSL